MRDMIVQQSQFQSPYWRPSMPIQVYPLLHSIPKKDGRKQWLECGLDTVHCLCGIYGYMRHHSAKVCADQLSHDGCLGLVTSYVRTWRFLAVSAVHYGSLFGNIEADIFASGLPFKLYNTGNGPGLCCSFWDFHRC